MAANIQDITIPQYAMSDNPIVLSARNTGNADGNITVSVIGGALVFSNSYLIRADGTAHYFDVSEVVKVTTKIPSLPPAPADVVGVTGMEGLVYVVVTGEGVNVSQLIYTFYGQLPIRELLRRGCTSAALLAEKFIEAQSNPGKAIPAPFFSVRSRSYAVNLYEGELTPLCFMSAEPVSLRVFNSVGAEVHAYNGGSGGGLRTYVLNLAPLVSASRKYFKIVFAGNAASPVHVSLSPNPQSRYLHEAVFLSSMGFYEKLLLTGAASRTRAFTGGGGEEEAATRQELLPALQLYRKVGVRRDVTETITLSAGYADADRLAVIADMVNSERILLDGEPVICTSSELVTRADDDLTEPREVELTFLSAES
jgi:hypothetical protein